jgi:hypothetical protein
VTGFLARLIFLSTNIISPRSDVNEKTLSDLPVSRLPELLPWNWKSAAQQAKAA